MLDKLRRKPKTPNRAGNQDVVSGGGTPKTLPPETPYSAAKREFNSIHGEPIVQAKNWRFVAIVSSLIALVAVFGLVRAATQSKFIPYVVEVDKFGSAQAVGLAAKGEHNDERITRAFLHRFIKDARMVTFDPAVQKEAVNRVFSVLANNTAANAKMSEYYASTNPFVRGQTEGVEAEISSILRISEKSWQIAWTERTRDPTGTVRNQTVWKSTVTIAFNAPTEEAQVLMNPLGMYVVDFDWRQELTK
jgi:type IV secretory pathway TrbF-like protein